MKIEYSTQQYLLYAYASFPYAVVRIFNVSHSRSVILTSPLTRVGGIGKKRDRGLQPASPYSQNSFLVVPLPPLFPCFWCVGKKRMKWSLAELFLLLRGRVRGRKIIMEKKPFSSDATREKKRSLFQKNRFELLLPERWGVMYAPAWKGCNSIKLFSCPQKISLWAFLPEIVRHPKNAGFDRSGNVDLISKTFLTCLTGSISLLDLPPSMRFQVFQQKKVFWLLYSTFLTCPQGFLTFPPKKRKEEGRRVLMTLFWCGGRNLGFPLTCVPPSSRLEWIKGCPFDFHTHGPFLFHTGNFHTKIYKPFYFHTVESSNSIMFCGQPFYFHTSCIIET